MLRHERSSQSQAERARITMLDAAPREAPLRLRGTAQLFAAIDAIC